jgi:hypothetical protein
MVNKTKTLINQRRILLNRAPERSCAPGVTRTLDLRIRNPLLYPAELRAQLRSEVAASKCDVQLFPGQRAMKSIMLAIGLAGIELAVALACYARKIEKKTTQ